MILTKKTGWTLEDLFGPKNENSQKLGEQGRITSALVSADHLMTAARAAANGSSRN